MENVCPPLLSPSCPKHKFSGATVGTLKTRQKKKKNKWGFPQCLNGKESTCQGRRQGSELWSRKIPHATEQLSPFCCCLVTAPQLLSQHFRAQELQLLKPVGPRAHAPQQEKRPQHEACSLQLKNSPHSNKDQAQNTLFKN